MKNNETKSFNEMTTREFLESVRYVPSKTPQGNVYTPNEPEANNLLLALAECDKPEIFTEAGDIMVEANVANMVYENTMTGLGQRMDKLLDKIREDETLAAKVKEHSPMILELQPSSDVDIVNPFVVIGNLEKQSD